MGQGQQTQYRAWPPGKWASTLPSSYFEEMDSLVDGMLSSLTERERESGYYDYVKCRNVFGRMEHAQTVIMPWIQAAIPDLNCKSVMEAGCGTGSATVPFAMAAAQVHAFDLAADTIGVAKKRCELLSLNNVSIFPTDVTWTERYLKEPRSVCDAPVDVVVSHALMEHLMPIERLQLLIGAWKHLPIGGYFIVIEAPNRLYPFDWHSAQQSFVELPDELSFLWNAFSPRPTMPPDIVAQRLSDLPKMNRERAFRFGKGVGFHEFHIALGAAAYEVVSSLERMTMLGSVEAHVEALKGQLRELSPPVHPGFAYPSLDLIIQKKGEARLG